MKSTYFQQGQALVELLLAMTMIFILIPVFLTGIVSSRDGRVIEENRSEGTAILQETQEAVRNIRGNGWAGIGTTGSFHPRNDGLVWYLQSGTEVRNGKSIRVLIGDARRDVNGALVSSGGTVDPSTKLITYTVSWSSPEVGSIVAQEYLGRYVNNAELSHTTQAQFNTGTRVNTTVTAAGNGTFQLTSGTGAFTFVDNYDDGANYTFDTSKVEVTGGYAQLKGLNPIISGSTTNPNFTTNATGWTYGEWGHTSRVSGTWSPSGGNTGGNIPALYTRTVNQAAGGYWRQTVQNFTSNPTSQLSFEWSASTFEGTPNPDSFRVYAFLDTNSTAPILGTEVWSSGQITGVTAWSGAVNVDMSSKMITSGTYYLKLAAYLDYNNTSTKGPFLVRFDNAQLTWTGTQASTTYATDYPTIYQSPSLADPYIVAWSTFSASETPNGGSIVYQLSPDDGANWWYYTSSWVLATLNTHVMTAATTNTRIPTFPATSKKIAVRAFLRSNGLQWVRLNSVTVGYKAAVAPGGLISGTFTSASLDAGATVAMHKIKLSGSQPTGTTIRFRIANNTNNSTWNYVGPDNTTTSFYTGMNGMIPIAATSARYIRYRVFFESTVIDVPQITDVFINYSP